MMMMMSVKNEHTKWSYALAFNRDHGDQPWSIITTNYDHTINMLQRIISWE